MGSLLAAFGIQTHLLVAQLVNFAVLFAVLWYFLYRPTMKMLDERRQIVAKGVEDAKEASEALSGAQDTARTITRAAETDAEGIMTRAREEAAEEHDRLTKEAQARAASIETDAQTRAKELHEKTLRDSEKEIARLAILAAEKAMRKT